MYWLKELEMLCAYKYFHNYGHNNCVISHIGRVLIVIVIVYTLLIWITLFMIDLSY